METEFCHSFVNQTYYRLKCFDSLFPFFLKGVYSVILAVHDNCQPLPGNYQLSRRFILYDAGDTDVSIRTNFPLRVTSSTMNTTYTWQVDVAASGMTQVSLDWTGRFINTIHHNLGLLKPIAEHEHDNILPGTCDLLGMN